MLSNKEAYDIKTMRYFIPDNKYKNVRISKRMEIEMADLSSRGIKPKRQSKGFELLRWGKIYRDLHITMWRDDVSAGLITKHEIYSSLPKWLKGWAQLKLDGVPSEHYREA